MRDRMSFNSKMVRLIELFGDGKKADNPSFNSKMVRLIGITDIVNKRIIVLFQFQNGAIDRSCI